MIVKVGISLVLLFYVVSGQETCTSGTFQASQGDCESYELCLDGKWERKKCPNGLMWNSEENFCEINDGSCKVEKCAPGQFQAISECNQTFQTCCNGDWVDDSCPKGLVFDSQSMFCVSKDSCENHVIKPIPCGDVAEGAFRAVPNNCTHFEFCYQGEWIEKSCPNGMMYDASKAYCVQEDGSCKVNCTTGETKATDDSTCNEEFLVCCDNAWKVEKCPAGLTFDSQLLYCTLDESCNENNVCDGQPDGSFRPDENDCQGFEICTEGKWSPHKCVKGMMYDAAKGYCVLEDGSCKPICTTGQMKPKDNSTCIAEFLVCCDNAWKTEECSSGQLFDPSRQFCVESSKCGNTICQDGVMKPKDNSTCNEEFLVCHDSNWEVKKCPKGLTFDSELLYCTLDESCNENNDCDGQPDGSFRPDENDCQGFEICTEGKWSPHKCIEGMMYDAAKGYCVIEDGSCKSTCSAGEMKPKDNSTCNEEFFICCDNAWEIEKCPPSLTFNSQLLYCALDESCNTTNECDGLPSGSMRPIKNDCQGFEICSEGQWSSHKCPGGMMYDASTMYCVSDDGSCKPICSPGEMKPKDNSTCNEEFLVCCDNAWKIEKCPSGLTFNTQLLYCALDESCSKDNSCSNEIDGSFRPDEKDCQGFEICTEGKWSPHKCVKGMMYDAVKRYCVLEDGSCKPSCSTGQRKAKDNSTCSNEFLVCCDNAWKIETCSSGQLFDPSKLFCVEPNNCQI